MASNPMLNAVLLFQNHQTTTPQLPIRAVTFTPVVLPKPASSEPQEFIPPANPDYQPGPPQEERIDKEKKSHG